MTFCTLDEAFNMSTPTNATAETKPSLATCGKLMSCR
jgi:hypothetical protein